MNYCAIILVLVILLILSLNKLALTEVVVNGEPYNVQRIFADKEIAANRLNEINTRVFRFFRYLKKKYNVNTYNGETNGLNAETTGIVQRILKNYNPETIVETNPIVSQDTSYTIDKTKLHVCMREKKPPYKVHEVDDLMFVVLHEIAHMGNISWGHGPDFWATFKFILHEGYLSGFYQPINYKLNPRNYCGLKIDYNPYYDKSIPDLWR